MSGRLNRDTGNVGEQRRTVGVRIVRQPRGRAVLALGLTLGLLGYAAAAGGQPAAGKPAVGFENLPTNKWTALPAGPGNPYCNPVYDPGTKQIVMLMAGGNGTAHLDPATGRWQVGLTPTPGASGGDCPLMKHYGFKDGRPNYTNMLLYHMIAYDSKRQRLVAGAPGFMAAYDASAKAWTNLNAKVELFGKQYPGVPPVAWGSMCYDPVNDELVLMPGGAIFNFDRWEQDKEVTGAFGTWIFDFEKNLWTRPQIGPAEFYQARDLIHPVRIALQDVMSAAGEAILLDRDGKADEVKQKVGAQAEAIVKVAADLKTVAAAVKALGGHPRLAAGAAKLEEAAGKLVKEGAPDDLYKAQFEAFKLVTAAVNEDLWSHPHFRTLSRMVYLPEQKSILLFGGHDQRQMLNDTWMYDCTKREWQKKNPKTLPRPRMMQTMAYHSKLKSAVMAGGYDSFWFQNKSQIREEVWTYDAAADDWKLALKEFPFVRGQPSYFAEYSEAGDAIVLVRGGRETFALRLEPGAALEAPKSGAFPRPEDVEPFLPPADDPAVLARWQELPANQWHDAKAPAPKGFSVYRYDWGMMGYNGRMHCAMLWGGGHSTHQANDIALYFPGANRWVSGYPTHWINIPPWNQGCGNPGGVDWRGGVFNLHARRGLSGNGTRALITIQCFSPYWYGPDAFMRQPDRWGKTTTFEFDYFSRRWRMPMPAKMAMGMCYPYNAKNSVMSVDASGAFWYDREQDTWVAAAAVKCPVGLNAGEGEANLFVEKHMLAMIVGPVGKSGIKTWALDIGAGVWKDLQPKGAPPGRPTVLAYCEADDSVFAGCFLGWDKKLRGSEAVYSFKRNAWAKLPTNAGSYHSAWGKVVYDRKHNLLIQHGGGSRMLVMRPDFDKLDWEKVK